MILPGQGPAAFLRQARDELRQLHLAGEGGRELARRRADLVDLALISLFRQAEHQVVDGGRYRESGLAVVALGGYGRRELSPFSDIDLMLLYRPEDTSRVQETAECLFYPLVGRRPRSGARRPHRGRVSRGRSGESGVGDVVLPGAPAGRTTRISSASWWIVCDRGVVDRRGCGVRSPASGGAGSASRRLRADGHVGRTRSEGWAGWAARRARGLLAGLRPARRDRVRRSHVHRLASGGTTGGVRRRRPTASCGRGRLCTTHSVERSTGSTWMCRTTWPRRSARSNRPGDLESTGGSSARHERDLPGGAGRRLRR